MRITVAGHLCLDIIPSWAGGGLDSLQPGKMVLMDGVTFSTGGAVANTGIALKKLGFEPTLMGRIGNDHLGQIILSILEKEQINPHFMSVIPGAITSYTVVLDPPHTDRIFLHFPGTNDTFRPDDVDFAKVPQGIFHFGYPPLMRQMYANTGANLKILLERAKEHDLITSLDLALPDPHTEQSQVNWQEIFGQVLPLVDFFLPSLDELLFMLDRATYYELQTNPGILTFDLLEHLSSHLLGLGARVIGIKLGEQGLYLRTDRRCKELLGDDWTNRELHSPIFKVNVEGTTGAGDTTIAGFLAGVALGKCPEEALTLANAVGAYSVEKTSATEGVVILAKVQERIDQGWKRVKPTIDSSSWHPHQSGVLLGPFDKVK